MEIVVLLHCIGHTKWNMVGIEIFLKRKGYQICNIDYPSLKYDIDYLTTYLHKELIKRDIWETATKVHFVTHSMGGLVTRDYLQKYKDNIDEHKLGRVVMMAPPLGGSEVADFLKDFLPYKWVFGPAGQQLTTAHQKHMNKNVYYELGVIAAVSRFPKFFQKMGLSDEHDGCVTIESTKALETAQHIQIRVTHSVVSWSPRSYKQILSFLRRGDFFK